MKLNSRLDAIALTAQIVQYLGKKAGIFPYTVYSEWKHLIPDIHFQQFDETDILNAIDQSFKRKWTLDILHEGVAALGEEDQRLCAKLIYTFLIMVKDTGNAIAWQNLREEYVQFSSPTDLTKIEYESVKDEIEDWIDKKERNSFRPIIPVRVSLFLVIVDFVVRLIIIGLVNRGLYINSEGDFWFWMLPLASGVVFLFAVLYRAITKRVTDRKLKRLQLPHIRLIPHVSSWDYFILAILAFLGVSIGELVMENLSNNSVLLFAIMVLSVFVWHTILLRSFSIPVPSSKVIYQKLKERNQIDLGEEMDSDDNDVEIVNLEVKLRSLNDKMNAFVLEAALFGALAFSGFIQIISAEIFTLEAFSDFNFAVVEMFRNIILWNPDEVAFFFRSLLHRDTLLSMLCYESLFCSISFLAVISSRLRFSDLTDVLDRALQMSKNFNKKEEGLILHQGKTKEEKEVKEYGQKIRYNIQQGLKDYRRLNPVLTYMRFFRTLGIGTFFVIIITGGLFISPLISSLFIAIFLLSSIYFRFEAIRLSFFHARTRIQEMRARTERAVTIGFFIFVFAVSIYRSFYLSGSQFLGFMVLVILGLHQLTLLVEGKRLRFTNQVSTRILRVAGLFFFLGIAFKWMHYFGAGPLLIIGAFLIVMFFFFHYINAEEKFTIRVVGIALGLIIIGALFKIQHWPFADVAKTLGTIGLIGAAAVVGLKRNWKRLPSFHQWAMVIVIIAGVQAYAFQGVTFRMISKLNWNFKDAMKEARYGEDRDSFYSEVYHAGFGTDSLDMAEMSNVFKFHSDSVFDWARSEPIYGFWLSGKIGSLANHLYQEQGKTLSPEALNSMIQFDLDVLRSVRDANQNYLASTTLIREEMEQGQLYSLAYYSALLGEYDQALEFSSLSKFTSQSDHYVDSDDYEYLDSLLLTIAPPDIANRDSTDI